MTQEWEPHDQRWRECRRCWEREPGRLQLRVVLRRDEGVCNVLYEEDEDCVRVLVLVCGPPTGSWAKAVDCPVHIYLERPLGKRRVLDIVRGGAPLKPFVRSW